MKKILLQLCLNLVLLMSTCHGDDFPDLGGLLDFSKPDEISDRLFIMTNPKSGSHLLLYSIMKITKRPMRGRLQLWHFLEDPACFPPENVMKYELDFSKPTTYWGHEYHILKTLNHSGNKLIFILRDFKENVISNLIINHQLIGKADKETVDKLFRDEILNEGRYFQEYLIRLQLFDDWDPAYRCLVQFNDLVHYPETFVPQVLGFIDDDSEYLDFVDHYTTFQREMLIQYRKKGNGTGSVANPKFFRRFLSKKTLREVDAHMKEHYPILWERYLKRFKK